MDNRATDQLFKSLSDGGRRDLLRLLAEVPLTVGELVDLLGLPQSTVSRHLKILRSTGMLVDRREGNRVFASLVEPCHNGNHEISDLLNQWLRSQDIPDHIRTRLDHILERREGAEDSYHRLAQQWDELRREYFGSGFHLEALCALLPRRWHVLDIGTGTGFMLPLLARHFHHVTAVDPSPAMLELARQRAVNEEFENITFSLGRLEALPLERARVDAVLAILVLHHAEDIEASLREIERVLKPGGLLLVVDLEPHTMQDFQQKMGDPRAGVDATDLGRQMKKCGLAIDLQRALIRNTDEELGGPLRPAPNLYLIRGNKTGRHAVSLGRS